MVNHRGGEEITPTIPLLGLLVQIGEAALYHQGQIQSFDPPRPNQVQSHHQGPYHPAPPPWNRGLFPTGRGRGYQANSRGRGQSTGYSDRWRQGSIGESGQESPYYQGHQEEGPEWEF